MSSRQTRRGFTLIEILVVIAIIALLSAILFPILSSAREKARTTNCASNEHQIALALAQYTQDNGRRFPPNDAGNIGWTTPIYPYLGINPSGSDPAIFVCPSENDGEPPAGSFNDYWLNSELAGEHDVRIRYPSNTLLIGDSLRGGASNNMGPDGSLTPWSPTAEFAIRHSGGANYAFVDGHVKWLRPEVIDTKNVASSDNFAFFVRPPAP
jgi:prepilin-type N-terminal cleavage/methylation domain-containing protein/prepilin-type processing-associated H-X9-DG protein